MAMRIKFETIMNNRLRTHHSTEFERDSSFSDLAQESVEDKEVVFLNKQAELINEQFKKIRQIDKVHKRKHDEMKRTRYVNKQKQEHAKRLF